MEGKGEVDCLCIIVMRCGGGRERRSRLFVYYSNDVRWRWPSGLERWLVQATGLSWPGSNPTAENFASELWQFRLSRFASVFRRRH